jgi:hypothetical protein
LNYGIPAVLGDQGVNLPAERLGGDLAAVAIGRADVSVSRRSSVLK